MNRWRRLKQSLARWAIPNLTFGILAVQVLAYGVWMIEPAKLNALPLVPTLVLHGEPWRLLSFIADPPKIHPIFAFFGFYLFYLMGSALEQTWGAPRYNLFLLIGYAATVGVAFLTPDQPTYNVFIGASIFLAFAWLFPNFELMLFFIIPVKIKYLALLSWIGYLFVLVEGSWPARLAMLASLLNYLLFLGGDIKNRMVQGRRHMVNQAKRAVPKREAFHRCTTCGMTNLTNPEMEFRYCGQCAGTCGYCSRHLHAHEHVKGEEEGLEARG
ncbi:MAG: hypothetical protein JSS27_16720 [Planctomycetes bacterium]|nr:hypothetical protein [Planctomycetota bacterium]